MKIKSEISLCSLYSFFKNVEEKNHYENSLILKVGFDLIWKNQDWFDLLGILIGILAKKNAIREGKSFNDKFAPYSAARVS